VKRSLLGYIAILGFSLFLSAEMRAQDIEVLDVSSTDETCSDADDGTITISVTGGTKPYVYYIIHGLESYNSPSTNDTVFTFTNVWATNWNILVEDNLSVADFGKANVKEPKVLEVQSETITPITCTGFGDGIITIVATGESGSYNFTLNPGSITNTTGVFTGLSPNTYTFDVTDATGRSFACRHNQFRCDRCYLQWSGKWYDQCNWKRRNRRIYIYFKSGRHCN